MKIGIDYYKNGYPDKNVGIYTNFVTSTHPDAQILALLVGVESTPPPLKTFVKNPDEDKL